MIYVVVAVLFLLVIGGGIILVVTASTRGSAPFEPDDAPAGDTREHAGDQDRSGHTVNPADQTGGPTGERGAGEGRFKRDPVGGEAEGETTIETGQVPRPRGS